jgi:hypothetical protein
MKHLIVSVRLTGCFIALSPMDASASARTLIHR